MKTAMCAIVGCACLGSGCVWPRPVAPPVRVSDQPRAVTLDIDARDYNEIAKRLYDSLVQCGNVQKGKTVSLGPVSVTFDDAYTFDPRTLQEKLQVFAHRSALLEFSFAVDAISANSAAHERFRIMQLQWEKENAVNGQALQTFGKLAKIDYLLFGRLTSRTAAKSAGREVTYTFNWKLGECETGLIVWTDEMETTKSTR